MPSTPTFQGLEVWLGCAASIGCSCFGMSHHCWAALGRSMIAQPSPLRTYSCKHNSSVSPCHQRTRSQLTATQPAELARLCALRNAHSPLQRIAALPPAAPCAVHHTEALCCAGGEHSTPGVACDGARLEGAAPILHNQAVPLVPCTRCVCFGARQGVVLVRGRALFWCEAGRCFGARQGVGGRGKQYVCALTRRHRPKRSAGPPPEGPLPPLNKRPANQHWPDLGCGRVWSGWVQERGTSTCTHQHPTAGRVADGTYP